MTESERAFWTLYVLSESGDREDRKRFESSEEAAWKSSEELRSAALSSIGMLELVMRNLINCAPSIEAIADALGAGLATDAVDCFGELAVRQVLLSVSVDYPDEVNAIRDNL